MIMDTPEPAPDLEAGFSLHDGAALTSDVLDADSLQETITPATPTRRQSRAWAVLREVLLSAAMVAVVFLGTREVAQGREVLGPSMQPTFHQGQRIFITKYLVGNPAHGDVVVFKPPVQSPDDYIKRVIGVPGDHVVVRNGKVSVNDQTLTESYAHGQVTACGGQYCDVTLGPDQYYVMGDNRANSADSRFWGPVNGSSIKGKAWLRFYPLDEFKFAP
jgi:signal peptidase I